MAKRITFESRGMAFHPSDPNHHVWGMMGKPSMDGALNSIIDETSSIIAQTHP